MALIKDNVISDEEYLKISSETIRLISQYISKSVGPYGSTSILEDEIKVGDISKDGYTILNKLQFDNSISNNILNFVKNVSFSLVKEVGDGSSSAIISSYKMYELLMKEINSTEFASKRITRKKVLDELEKIANIVSEKILEDATEINEDNFEIIKHIATISNNNDEKLGQIIHDIYKEVGKDGFITLEESSSSTNSNDKYSIVNGITTNRGYVDDIFINQADRETCKLLKPNIIMIDGDLTHDDIQWIQECINISFIKRNEHLLIMANSFSPELMNNMRAIIFANRNNPTKTEVGLCMVDYATIREDFRDIAVFTGGTVLKKDDEDFHKEIETLYSNPEYFRVKIMGSASKIMITSMNTEIVDGNGKQEEIDARTKKLEDRINYLKEQEVKNNSSNSMEIVRLETRIANLNSRLAILYISGQSKINRAAKKYLLEDSIFACRSALNHGYISGQNLIVSKTIEDLNLVEKGYSKELVDIINLAMQEVAKVTIRNTLIYTDTEIEKIVSKCIEDKTVFNLNTEEYEKDNNTKIINSAMTDVAILKSVLSIIGTIVTSNQYISKMIQ